LIANGISLVSKIRDVKDQGRDGSCATESTAGAMQLIREWNNRDFVELNPLSIYAFTKGRTGGSSIDTNLVRARDVGILPESIWPRSKGWHNRPSLGMLNEHASKYRIDEFWDINTMAELRTAVLSLFPVVFGWRGHSCVLVELTDMDTALYLNSWGKSWGDNGIGEIQLDSIELARYGAFAVRSCVDSGT
jgi:hypothetical protein